MRILIDTHTLLWFHEDSDQLSSKARAAILAEDSERFVSYASLWEIAIKSSRKRLNVGMELSEFVEKNIIDHGMSVLDLKISHLEEMSSLPWHHRDPFDRILMAQAISENLTLISGDKTLSQYEVNILW